MIVFRERALEALNAPDALDQPLPLLRPGWWGVLLGLLLLAGTVLAWAIVGRLPVRIQGRGVLLRPESLVPVQSRSSGPVEQILTREGDCVQAGQAMARVEQVQLRLALDEGRRRVEQLRSQDQLARLQDREVIWLPFHAVQDRGLLEQLDQQQLLPAGLAGRSREVLAERPSEAMAVASGAGLVVAMRLHGLILAALAGAPCAALSYDPKVQAAADGLGCPCHSLDAMAAPAELPALVPEPNAPSRLPSRPPLPAAVSPPSLVLVPRVAIPAMWM